ncbi:MAG: hypothetical protein UR89_C0007G0004 [Candidatus Roizmanbacteria bacterium GW2011_GWA2_35_8]|uniref:Transposase IS200-like domain-containing protein n=1 Tax=Candidatus Roizmanbacteria bacterium GW2011_GWA2_35_8 TaxID=1618479 RepID=A0A0G0FHZ0_9BACT|nr:MAG: hypothetical protein UR89_C0007G0004 [Candidatus Roizmanbacteria bacterium GW2011_GWA2_35_8]
MHKKRRFLEGEIYHVFNRSIARYGIFSNLDNGLRFVQTLDYYNNPINVINLGTFLKKNKEYSPDIIFFNKNNNVKYISYCIMPDHYHLLLKVLKENMLSKYISDVENSFSRFFNIKLKRKGPIWESRFKAVRVKTNEQLLHVSRYIHLNPTSSNLVEKPEDWIFSSYKSFITKSEIINKTMNEISISDRDLYKKFIEGNIDYQRKLKKIRNLFID